MFCFVAICKSVHWLYEARAFGISVVRPQPSIDKNKIYKTGATMNLLKWEKKRTVSANNLTVIF